MLTRFRAWRAARRAAYRARLEADWAAFLRETPRKPYRPTIDEGERFGLDAGAYHEPLWPGEAL